MGNRCFFPDFYHFDKRENDWVQYVAKEIFPLVEEEVNRCKIELEAAEHFFQAFIQ